MSTVHVARAHHHAEPHTSGLRVWPLRKAAVWVIAKGALLVLAVWSAVGLLYVHLLDDGPIGDADRAVPEWFEDRRTPRLNSWTYWGSMLSDTLVKVVLVALVGGAMVLIWRRWHDGVFLALTVSLEATLFVITSFIVGRDRPPVEQLDGLPPSGSFPSGHAAAATAFYSTLFVVVCWHTRNRAIRTCFAALAVLAPIIVGVSRVARGMHHPIDVVAGILLGIATLLVVRAGLRAGVRQIDDEAASKGLPVPDRVRRLDLTEPDPAPEDPFPLTRGER